MKGVLRHSSNNETSFSDKCRFYFFFNIFSAKSAKSVLLPGEIKQVRQKSQLLFTSLNLAPLKKKNKKKNNGCLCPSQR